MKYSKFALPLVVAALAAGCGKLSTNNDAATTQPAAATTPPVTMATPPAVVATTPPAATPEAPIAASQPPASSGTESVQQFAQVRRTAQDQKDYTFAQKGDFIQNMTAALDQLNQEVIQLSAKIDLASDAVKQDERSKIGTLQTQLHELDAKLGQVEISTEANWEQTKADALQTYAATKQAIQDTNQRLNQ